MSIDREQLKNMERSYYAPSDSYEYYDPNTDSWYNSSGLILRDPSAYNTNTEGYTPFGDE